jgi:hypothetical protein
MRQLMATLILGVLCFVAFSGVAPNAGTRPALEQIADDLATWASLR